MGRWKPVTRMAVDLGLRPLVQDQITSMDRSTACTAMRCSTVTITTPNDTMFSPSSNIGVDAVIV